MKKEILDALKAKFEGVSESILVRIAEKGAKTVKMPGDVTSFVEGVTLQQLFESYGDSRATEAADKAVFNYEKKHGLKDGVKDDSGGDPSKKNEPVNESGSSGKSETANPILEAINKLKSEIYAQKGEKVADALIKCYNGVIDNVPDAQKSRLTKDFHRLKNIFKDDDNFEEHLCTLVCAYVPKKYSAKTKVYFLNEEQLTELEPICNELIIHRTHIR